MEAFVETMDEPRRKDRVARKAPVLGNSWSKEGSGRGHKKKDLRYWGVGGVEGPAGDKAKKRALMGVEDPFEGF